MGASTQQRKGNEGQATIEMALILPLLIWLIYYTLNAFHTIHTAHIGQKYAAMNLYQRMNNRSKLVVDDGGPNGTSNAVGREFMAVSYRDPDGRLPRRKILLDPRANSLIQNVVGVCGEPGCQ